MFYGSWDLLRPSWSILTNFGAILDPIWGTWGPFWSHLGASGGHFGAILVYFGVFWSHFEPFWSHFSLFGPPLMFWWCFTSILSNFEAILTFLGHLGASWGYFQSCRAILSKSQAISIHFCSILYSLADRCHPLPLSTVGEITQMQVVQPLSTPQVIPSHLHAAKCKQDHLHATSGTKIVFLSCSPASTCSQM